MRSLVLIAAVTTLVAARPELYRENEDFQFSRSSTDEGSKSGYYGAQRGNMGGNYEKAHNMDGLAQHQMSGAIQQTEGELGDAAKMRTGSVYTAANSRGIYGSGRYNLHNLEGRNFQEGVAYDDSQSRRNSAFRQNSSGSNRYSNIYSHSSEQRSSQQLEHQNHEMQSSNLQDDLYRHQEYSGLSGTSGLSHMLYPQSRLINTRPVRIMIRPGSRVSVPVATQIDSTNHRASTYDSSSYDHNAAKSDFAHTYNADRRASSYDSSSNNYNAAKSDAEVIINNDHERNSRYPSNSKNRQYEQSYSYQKEWERHDTDPEVTPLSITTESSLHEGSQLYDNSQVYKTRDHYRRNEADSQSAQHNSNIKTASSSQGRYRSSHNSQQGSLSSSTNSNAHTYDTHYSGSYDDHMRQLAQQGQMHTTNENSKPQSYQSSYSYHKSWERQGDPYVIEPVTTGYQNGHASQRMTASNAHDSHSSHHYGSQHKQSYQSYLNGLDGDCEEGHTRVARSYNTNDEFYTQQNQQFEQAQNGWENLGQQTQDQWGDLENRNQGIQSENKRNNLEDLGQQSQNSWDKVEDLGQQTQNSWDKVDDMGQQSQNKWDNLEDLGQQTQNKWDKIEDLGQQTQNSWDKVEDLEQQGQNKWDKIEDLDQQSYNKWDVRQQSHGIEDLSQQSQTRWEQFNHGQESHSNTDQHTWDQMNESGIHTNSNNFGPGESTQQFEDSWDFSPKIHKTFIPQDPQKPESSQTQNTNEQETITNNTDTPRITQGAIQDLKNENYSNNLWDKIDTFGSLQNNQYFNTEIPNSNSKHFNKPQDTNDNAGFYDQQTNTDVNNEHHIIAPNNIHNITENQNNNNQYNRQSQFDSTYSSNSWYDSSLNNFWKKMDSFEHESDSYDNGVETGNDSEVTRNNFTHYSSQDIYNKQLNESHSTHGTNQDNQFSTTNDKQANDSYGEIMSTTIKTKVDANTVSLPRDVGRGDIGAEDFAFETTSTTTQKSDVRSDLDTLQVNYNKYKTPEQIEALSLIKDNNVSDIDMLKNTNRTFDTTDVPEPIEITDQEEKEMEINNFELEQFPDEINRQLHNQQQNSKYSQDIQSPQKDFEEYSHSSHRQNNEQNLEDFGQQNQNLNEQNMEQNFEDLEQHNEKKQQNMEKSLEDFGQRKQELIHQNMEQNLEDFGQHSQEFVQQNMEQNMKNFGHRSHDLHQQNTQQDFWHHSQDVNRQNMEKNIEDLEQHGQDLYQRNMDQNLENFEQQYQDFHSQRLGDFGQHSQDLSREKLENLGRQSQDHEKSNIDRNLQYFWGQNFNDENRELGQEDFLSITQKHQPQTFNQEEMPQNTENKDLEVENFTDHYKNKEVTETTFVEHRGRNFDQFKTPHNQALQSQDIHNPRTYSFDHNKQDDYEATVNAKSVPQLDEENNVSSTTAAPVTEKSGFWSSVGNKLSQAKNKVASWFRSS